MQRTLGRHEEGSAADESVRLRAKPPGPGDPVVCGVLTGPGSTLSAVERTRDVLDTRMLVTATWRVTGDAAEGRATIPCLPGHDPRSSEYEAWYVDTRRAAVAALWREGTLWLGGSAMYALGEGVETLAGSPQGPANSVDAAVRGWARVTPTPGMRYVVISSAGTMRDESARIITRRFAASSRPTGESESPGTLAEALILAQLADAGNSRPEVAVLVLEVTESEEPDELVAWLDVLRGRGIDLSWRGNEAGPGLLHTFTRALRIGQDVPAALLEHARGDTVVTTQIIEHASVWLEELGGAAPLGGQFLPGEPQHGYWHAVDLGQLASDSRGSAGAWIDPSTANARLAHLHHLPGGSVVAQLQACVDELAAVCITSQPDPDSAVLACHVVGGLDRRSGEVVGFVLARIWT